MLRPVPSSDASRSNAYGFSGAPAPVSDAPVVPLGPAEKASLDTGGTTSQDPENTRRSLVATGDQASCRQRIARVLKGVSPDSIHSRYRRRLRERGETIERCGGCVIAYAHADGRARAIPTSCDDALCPRCAWHRARKARDRYDIAVTACRANGEKVRVMTLTQPVERGETWHQANARLMASFRSFWRDKQTRARVEGGMRRVETTWSHKCQGWHVHIHFVYEGRFWPSDELACVWSKYSEGKVVDVREADRPQEFFKYLIKTADVPSVPLVEYAVQSAGRRLIEFLGSWRKLELPDPEENQDDWFQVDVKGLRALEQVEDDYVPWRLHSYLRHLGTKEPRELRRWSRRVLHSYEAEIDKHCEREVERRFRELSRAERKKGRGG